MRGISSCMGWGSHHSQHLIGSIIDPYTGLVFLTDKSKTKHGISFYKRAVVRLMVYTNDLGKRVPVLFMERPYKQGGDESYGGYLNGDDDPKQTFNVFKTFLLKHLNKDIKICSEEPYHMPRDYSNFYVPKASCMRGLAYDTMPFSDANYGYSDYDDGSKVIQSLTS
jgi:hypothetical protein